MAIGRPDPGPRRRRLDPRVVELASGGPVRRTPQNAGLVRSAVRHGLVSKVLPGVHVPSGQLDDIVTRCLALALYDPRVIVTGRAAAALTWRAEWPVHSITGAGPHGFEFPGFRVTEETIPPELVVTRGPLRILCTSANVVQLIPECGGQVIDDALRLRATTLRRLRWAFDLLPPKWPGNTERAWLLADSRDSPWSEAERHGQRALRQAGVTGWVTNHRVSWETGTAFLDFGMPALMLAFKIDGHASHSSAPQVIHDRDRDTQLAALGWQVVRFPWTMPIADPDEFVRRVWTIIESRCRLFGTDSSRFRTRIPRTFGAPIRLERDPDPTSEMCGEIWFDPR